MTLPILDKEAEGIIQWNYETGKLGHIDYDPRLEFAEFTLTFKNIVERIRTLTEVKQDQKLDEIHREVGDIKILIEGLRLDRSYSPLPTSHAERAVAQVRESDWVRGELIYQLDLTGDVDQIKAILSNWHFITTSVIQPSAVVANEVIGIGHNDGVTFNLCPIEPVHDCSIDCEIRIIDHGTDEDNWAGIRLRAFDFCYDLRLGYLIYMRRSGSVELYGPEGIMAGFGQKRVYDTKEAWTYFRVDILGNELRVYVNGEIHLQSTDRTFGGRGRVFLQTFGAHAQFRNFRVYKLESRP